MKAIDTTSINSQNVYKMFLKKLCTNSIKIKYKRKHNKRILWDEEKERIENNFMIDVKRFT